MVSVSDFSPDRLLDARTLEEQLKLYDPLWQEAPLPHDNTLEDPAAGQLTRDYSAFGSAPFWGNGILGAMLWVKEQTLHFELGSSLAYDKRADAPILYGRNRIRLGAFALDCGEIETSGWDLHISLWNATAEGTIPTKSGPLFLQAFAHATQPVLSFTVMPPAGVSPRWRFCPAPADSVRPVLWVQPQRLIPDHEPGRSFACDGMEYYSKRLAHQADQLPHRGRIHDRFFVTAWQKTHLADGSLQILCTHQIADTEETACRQARDVLRKAACDPQTFYRTHCAWWHERYLRSAVFLPDAVLESFYWFQTYKLLSATRADGPVLDLFGPWFKPSGWIAVWANLNVQMAYSPVACAGQYDLFDALLRWLDPQQLQYCAGDAFHDGAMALPVVSLPDSLEDPLIPPKGLLEQRTTLGNLPYCLVYVWERYAVTMDDDFLRCSLLPLLQGAFRYYLRFLVRGKDGFLHLPLCWSPEWGVNTEDSNFELALLRWCCRKLLWCAERLHLTDELFTQAQEVLRSLTPSPQDAEHGLYVGAQEPYHHSHRHWSHLFSIYPCGEITPDDPRQKDLIDASVRQYMSYQELYTGFSWVAIASLFVVQHRGDDAVKSLYRLLKAPYLWPNTMYTEMGELEWPTIETPIGVNRTIQEMLVSSRDTIEVFPALPETWADLSFFRLSVAGGFRISAARSQGKTSWICIESLAGEPCRLRLPEDFCLKELEICCKCPYTLTQRDCRNITITGLPRGSRILFRRADIAQPKLVFHSRPAHWGGRKPVDPQREARV